MMNIYDEIGRALVLQHEGNRQIAAALADGIQALVRRFQQLLGSAPRGSVGERQRR